MTKQQRIKEHKREWTLLLLEHKLDFFDEDIMQIVDKYIAEGFVSDDGYLFFEDKALEEKFNLAVDMLKELIKHTHKENNNAWI